MKTTHKGSRYDSSRCEIMASQSIFGNGNNYIGDRQLVRAKDGVFLIYQETNGQDCCIRDQFFVCEYVDEELEPMEMTDEQEKRAVEIGLIELV